VFDLQGFLIVLLKLKEHTYITNLVNKICSLFDLQDIFNSFAEIKRTTTMNSVVQTKL
jgi:hypothetical protein